MRAIAKAAGETSDSKYMMVFVMFGMNTTARYNNDIMSVISEPNPPADRAFEKNGVSINANTSCMIEWVLFKHDNFIKTKNKA